MKKLMSTVLLLSVYANCMALTFKEAQTQVKNVQSELSKIGSRIRQIDTDINQYQQKLQQLGGKKLSDQESMEFNSARANFDSLLRERGQLIAKHKRTLDQYRKTISGIAADQYCVVGQPGNYRVREVKHREMKPIVHRSREQGVKTAWKD